MEYVHGENLHHVLERAEPTGGIPLGLQCRIIQDAASALDHAHHARNSAGAPMALIHRDVSPQNILVSFDGTVKLVDFGIAKANGKLARTATGVIKGKFAYMSPEQAAGRPLDARSDVFALGIVFHEMLTGHRLFQRESDFDTLRAVTNGPIVAPSQIRTGVPKAIDAIVLKALERDRDLRYPSASAVRADLETLVRKQRWPASEGHLGQLMRGLFPKESAISPAELANRHEQGDAPPPRDQSDSTPTDESLENTVVRGSIDEELAARLRSISTSDRSAGLFFNGALAAVERNVGPHERRLAEEAVAAGPRQRIDALLYSTSDLLKVIFTTHRLLSTRLGSSDSAFQVIGREVFALMMQSADGERWRGDDLAPAELVRQLVQLLNPKVQPGSRLVSRVGPGRVEVVIKGDPLPVEVYGAIFYAAVEKLHRLRTTISWNRPTPDRTELLLTW